MNVRLHRVDRGIALLVVMVAIFVLSVLVGAFAYAMKVEARLAMNANREAELLWLGRSGVELARYVLALQASVMGEPYDALNQKWAGGPGTMNISNTPLEDISLENFPVGKSTITVKITDLERRLNINTANEEVLRQALTMIGVEAGQVQAITSAILDWIDPDDAVRPNGAESDEYQSMNPPYLAKNGPLDDLSELMFIRGITPEMYEGTGGAEPTAASFAVVDSMGRPVDLPPFSIGLKQVFTALSSGRVNINTASPLVLQMLPGIDANIAACIVRQRAGPDGVDGTEDDLPFRAVGELVNCMGPQLIPMLQQLCDVRSRTFEVEVSISGS
ncbi:MAG TPA: general secretion pathway protein GspK, partial [Verrucomicrobiota bacterium]|nr:general secretion pathway protein GspK [Verrucomicrobiota bacterium]